MARPQQSFILDQRDLARARTAAITAGMSLNAWMRRAMRDALDGPVPTTQASVGAALDPALLDRLAALIAKGEADTTASRAVLEDLKRAGGGIATLVAQARTAGAAPARPAASAPARPAARTDGLDEVRLSSGTR